MSQTDVALFPAVAWGDLVEHDGDFLLPVGTVTLLLADVEGSTRAWEQAPVEMHDAMEDLSALVAELIGRHDGVRPLEQGEGDSFVAAFARPSEAVACALAVQQKLADGPLAIRMGLHAGEVQRSTERTYVGPALNRAARLRDAAHGGQILVSRATAELVADGLPAGVTLVDLGSHRLKDLARPEHIYQLAHADLRPTFPPIRTLDSYRHNLPVQRTPLFGRRDEQRELAALVAAEQLVTLHGGGGYGKTRLALHVAAALVDDHPDGVFFVDLARVHEEGDIRRAVLDAMGFPQEAASALVPYVTAKRMLLVLDNCEHVVAGCASLADELLAASSDLRVLATSREPLGVAGEVTFPVPALAVPTEVKVAGLEGMTPYAAAELFLDRAKRARADFDVDADGLSAVAEICRRLEGVPLAIELAAARVRSMTPREVADGLDARFKLLTGAGRTALPRQQTLRASIDWSYDLLTDAERAVFRRLALFVGGFDLDAAKATAGFGSIAPHQVVDLVSLLVDKSLVVAEPVDGRTRFRLLETVRAYASERLDAAAEREETARAHATYFAVAAESLTRPGGADVAAAFRWFPQELENLRVAYQSSVAVEDVELAARLAASVTEFVMLGTPIELTFPEVNGWLDRVPSAVRSRYLPFAVFIGWVGPEVVPLLDADRAWCREHGLPGRAAALDVMRQRATWIPGTPVDIQDYDVALSTAEASGDLWDVLVVGALTTVVLEFLVEDVDPDPYWQRILERASRHPQTHRFWLIRRIYDLAVKGDYRRLLELARHDDVQGLDGRAAAALDPARARALIADGQLDAARSTIERLRAEAVEFGDVATGARAERAQAHLCLVTGDAEAAEVHLRAALAGFVQRLDVYTVPIVVRVHGELAEVHALRGDLEAADAAIATARQMSIAPWTAAYVDRSAATVARLRGDLDGAEHFVHQALGPSSGIADLATVVDLLEVLAGLWIARGGRCIDAVRLLGSVDATRSDVANVTRLEPYRTWWDEDVAAAREELGEETFTAAWNDGAAMSWRAVVDYVRRGRGAKKRPVSGWASLTPTEEQVVALVAEGLSNAAVAERMFISTRTVGTHLSHVFTKLGIGSRTELVAAVHRRRATG